MPHTQWWHSFLCSTYLIQGFFFSFQHQRSIIPQPICRDEIKENSAVDSVPKKPCTEPSSSGQCRFGLHGEPRRRAIEDFSGRSQLMSAIPPGRHTSAPRPPQRSQKPGWRKPFLSSFIFQKQYTVTNSSPFLTIFKGDYFIEPNKRSM